MVWATKGQGRGVSSQELLFVLTLKRLGYCLTLTITGKISMEWALVRRFDKEGRWRLIGKFAVLEVHMILRKSKKR